MSTNPFGPVPMGHLFTFAVVYGTGPDATVEEIDVEAPDLDSARKAAEAQAAAELEPGWDRIVPVAPGGSGGLVIF